MSLRKPELVKDKEGIDQYCLEKDSYDGLMSAIPHVPTWMTKIQVYSSKKSAKEIRPLCEKINDIVKELKSKELEIIDGADGRKFVRDLGISEVTEHTRDVIRACYERELLNLNLRQSWWLGM